MSLVREGQKNISAQDLNITDSRYGLTLPLYKCHECSFLQCEIDSLDNLYEQLEDTGYIESFKQREKQFEFLLKTTLPCIHGFEGNNSNLKILDVGAGTGLFVKCALDYGVSAQGIEPSTYLADYAISQGLPVVNASTPDYAPHTFDAIYMTDVLEHIADPLPLLKEYNKTLKDGGVIFMTTPDVSSFLARIMGKRWWHYRLAHVGYYNKNTLNSIMLRAGFSFKRYLPVRWYFAAEYAFERLGQYLPFLRGRRCPKVFKKLFIPISFGDSILSVYIKSETRDIANIK